MTNISYKEFLDYNNKILEKISGIDKAVLELSTALVDHMKQEDKDRDRLAGDITAIKNQTMAKSTFNIYLAGISFVLTGILGVLGYLAVQFLELNTKINKIDMIEYRVSNIEDLFIGAEIEIND